MNINHSLFIKYGLQKTPSDAQVEQWVSLVESLLESGFDKEAAGKRAAKRIFPDYNTALYASEADSIEGLLDAARKRGKKQNR